MQSKSDEKFHICFIQQLDNCITISQWWKNDKVESWRGGKMSKVEIILVEIVPISALYYRFHTISILQVRKLVVQVTSTSTSRKICTTSYKYKYKYNLQVAKNRPQKVPKSPRRFTCKLWFINTITKKNVLGSVWFISHIPHNIRYINCGY